jgi:hypothetical protein
MHEAEPYGHLKLNDRDIELKTLARMVGCPLGETRRFLTELAEAGVFSRSETGTIFSRRMVRDEVLRQKRAEGGHLSMNHPDVPRKKEGGKDTIKDTFFPSIMASIGGSPSSSFSSSSTSSENKREIADATLSTPASRPGVKRKVRLSDNEFMDKLRQNSAYKHLDIDYELGKMDAWLITPKGENKRKTRRFVVSWLNKAADEQRPLAQSASARTSQVCKERVNNGRHYKPCGEPIALVQPTPILPYCPEHLPGRQRVISHLSNGHIS